MNVEIQEKNEDMSFSSSPFKSNKLDEFKSDEEFFDAEEQQSSSSTNLNINHFNFNVRIKQNFFFYLNLNICIKKIVYIK